MQQLGQDSFAEATHAFLTHRPDIPEAIDRTLAADPYMVSAYLLEGFVNVILARPETIALAGISRAQATRAASVRGGTSLDEMAMLRALDMAVAGRLLTAADILDERLSVQPDAVLLAKLCHTLRYLAGDATGMLRTTSEILAYGPDMAGFGYVLGLHACALVESGDYAAAQRAGLEAVERDPNDAWAIHAVAHCFEMTGHPLRGVGWLDRTRSGWSRCGGFSHHIAWHLALFLLELRDYEHVLDLYDQAIRPIPSEDYLDVSNAVSLLFRLLQDGVDIGNRFSELAEVARRQRHEPGPVITRLHHLIALAVVGDVEACWDLLRAVEATANEDGGHQARVARASGVPLARLLFAAVQPWGDAARWHGKPLDILARSLSGLGWGQAERDVFVRLLAMQAARLGEEAALESILEERQRLKRNDRFVQLLDTMRRDGRDDGQ